VSPGVEAIGYTGIFSVPERAGATDAMKIVKLFACMGLLVGSVASAFALGAPANDAGQPAQAAPLRCDAVSFALGTPQGRAACRRQFARETRPNVQQAPLTVSDYAS
jgi:hypothetical protein